MKEHAKHIQEYKERLEKGICEYMQNPVSERSADAVKTMVKCWEHINDLQKTMHTDRLSKEQIMKWNAGMLNSDGTTGGHWTTEETKNVAEIKGIVFEHIDCYEWNVAMNMIYSDYCYVADKYGVGTVDFYADMAKAFLFDKDGGKPSCKLAEYYYNIVGKEK